jgi:hypothetical protein
MQSGMQPGSREPAPPIRPAAPAPVPTSRLLDRTALRQLVFAVSVLQDLDLVPMDDGVLVASGRMLPWECLEAALAGHDPAAPSSRTVLSGWLRAVQDLGWRSPDDLAARARPVGLPYGHVAHPGPTWIRTVVPGGAVHLGVGLLGLSKDPDEVVVLGAGLLEACGHDPAAWWPQCVAYLEEMGELAAARHTLHPERPLRPMGDCDVVTLLGSAAFRRGLAGKDPTGMRAAAMPTRRRGWLDLSRIDPAFARVAASLAESHERGFDRPLLITAEEVVMARDGGDPVLQAMRDASAPDPELPAVRYR